jgi:multicomponent K+:H+ antiporter subunit E
VLIDIVRSNIGVGRIILGFARGRAIHSGYLDIPLELRDPHGLAVLATIITSTPGTVWVGHDPERRVLTLHILDLEDGASWIRLIKDRYERPLLGIFQS